MRDKVLFTYLLDKFCLNLHVWRSGKSLPHDIDFNNAAPKIIHILFVVHELYFCSPKQRLQMIENSINKATESSIRKSCYQCSLLLSIPFYCRNYRNKGKSETREHVFSLNSKFHVYNYYDNELLLLNWKF